MSMDALSITANGCHVNQRINEAFQGIKRDVGRCQWMSCPSLPTVAMSITELMRHFRELKGMSGDANECPVPHCQLMPCPSQNKWGISGNKKGCWGCQRVIFFERRPIRDYNGLPRTPRANTQSIVQWIYLNTEKAEQKSFEMLLRLMIPHCVCTLPLKVTQVTKYDFFFVFTSDMPS